MKYLQGMAQCRYSVIKYVSRMSLILLRLLLPRIKSLILRMASCLRNGGQ